MKIDFSKGEILLDEDEFLKSFLTSIGLTGQNKEKVFKYILSNTDENKLFFQTQKNAAKILEISYPIVSSVFVTLIDKNILHKISNTQYLLNCPIKTYKLVLQNEKDVDI